MPDDAVIQGRVTLDSSDFSNKLNDMEKRTGSVLKKVAGFAVGYMGIKSLTGAVEKCVTAFTIQEDAVDDLDDALSLKGASSFSDQLQKVASDLQLVTTYGDEATMSTMALGINMGIPAEQMEDATKAAMGLSAAYGMDLNSAMMLLGKAYSGNTAALSRYGIIIDTTKSKSEQFAQVLQRGKDSFPLAEADTLGAKITQLQNVWGDFTEVIGEFIVELFGVGDGVDGVTQMLSDATKYIKDHLQEWVFEIKYVVAYIEEAIKIVWAIFEPAVTFLWQSFKAGISNIIEIGKWGFENFGKIWENLPDIFIGIGKDILQYWKNIFNGMLNLAVNLGKAIWTAIRGGGLDGFKETWDQLCNDAVKTIADSGRFTEEALAKAGVSAFPEMQSGNFGEMIDKYKNLGDKFSEIDRERAEKQARFEEEYANKLNKSKNGRDQRSAASAGAGVDGAGQGKNNVLGNFSAAILSAMLGGGSNPQEETAKNTKRMVELFEYAKDHGLSFA